MFAYGLDCLCCSAELITTNCTINCKFVRTIFYASCFLSIFFNGLACCVAIRRNDCLSNKYFATYGAMRSFCQTCVFTIRCYCFVFNYCVGFLFNCYCSSAKFSITIFTIGNRVVRAGCKTSRLNPVFLYCSAGCVICCRNSYNLGTKFFVTNCTVGV